MARSHGRIKVEIWGDSDFRALSRHAQRAYFMLLSQPQINNCGVLPYVPKKWAKLAADETTEELTRTLAELHGSWFIVIDEDTDELLVRTFIHHDKIAEQPNLEKAAKREYLMIESQRIREVLADHYPDLFAEGVREGVSEPLYYEGVREGVSLARAGARGCARTPAAPAPTPTPTPRYEREDFVSSLSAEAAAAEVLTILRQIDKPGYANGKLRPDRVQTLIDTYPDRDHLAEARALADWETHGLGANKPTKDGVHRFRNWLKRAEPREEVNHDEVDLSGYVKA